MELNIRVERMNNGFLIYPEGDKAQAHVATTEGQIKKAIKSLVDSHVTKDTTAVNVSEGEEHGPTEM